MIATADPCGSLSVWAESAASIQSESAWTKDGRRLTLRSPNSLREYHECERLQDLIWGPENIIRVSGLVLITAQNNGGIVIGAFSEHDELIGFVCSYPGLTARGNIKQCSQLMAVHPTCQNGHIGYELKLAQRRATLKRGIDLVTWTFDPLAGPNAHLNVNKLGAIAARYLPDCYGSGGPGVSLASDRLLVEWWVGSPWVEGHLRERRPRMTLANPPINDVTLRSSDGMAVNRRIDLERDDPAIRVEIPADFNTLKQRDMSLAEAWRMESREIFTTYLGRGYRVIGFEKLDSDDGRRCCHVLSDGTKPFELPEPGVES